MTEHDTDSPAIALLAPLLADAESRLLSATVAELEATATLAACSASVETARSERDRLNAAMLTLRGAVLLNVGKPDEVPTVCPVPPPPPPRPAGPYAAFECPGCGATGTLDEVIRVIRDRPMRMLSCSECRSERRL